MGKVSVPKAGNYRLRLGFDDWTKVWINAEEVFADRHDKGFDHALVDIELAASDVTVLVKLNNFDNLQWRNWAFALQLEPIDSLLDSSAYLTQFVSKGRGLLALEGLGSA